MFSRNKFEKRVEYFKTVIPELKKIHAEYFRPDQKSYKIFTFAKKIDKEIANKK